jgi:hypothetical protein
MNFFLIFAVTSAIWQVKAFQRQYISRWNYGFQQLDVNGRSVRSIPQLHLIRPRLILGFTRLYQDRTNDEIMDGWLNDMIFSGDMHGYMNRYAKDLLCDEFVDYLNIRMSSTEDKDEKLSIAEVLHVVKDGFQETDGLGVDSRIVYENRLNQILFTAPNQRRYHINENLNDMTPGFVKYIKEELHETADNDSKVVIASILKLIGEIKGNDLLGGASVMLEQADASLGEDFAKETDHLDIYNTVNGVGGIGDRMERILGSLFCSQNDIMIDIFNHLHEIDMKFVDYLNKKASNTFDIEEKVALNSLKDTVKSVLDRISEIDGTDYRNMDDETELNIQSVKQKMLAVQAGKNFNDDNDDDDDAFNKQDTISIINTSDKYKFEIQYDKKDTFQKILNYILKRPMNESINDSIQKHYYLCDYEFMEMLKNEITVCLREGADIEAEQYSQIIAEINKVMVERIGGAQERLQCILANSNPESMESEIVAMARKNEIDEALVLLMEANLQQAANAGPQGEVAVKILKRLIQRANDERERKLPDEQRLLRALMRLDSSEERKGLLFEAFKSMKHMTDDQEFMKGEPMIKPPIFIRVVRQLIQSFGNADDFNIMGRAEVIIDEAQEVATELYGEGMTSRQQQEFMFNKKTVSVWDLGDFEDKAIMSGENVPWSNDSYDDKMPEDVLSEVASRKIGGIDGI